MPALNTNKAFIDDLAEAVIEALPYVGQMVGPAEGSLVPIGERGCDGSTHPSMRRNTQYCGITLFQ